MSIFSEISFSVMSHLIDTNRHRQDHGIILAGLDLHAVGIPNPEPFLGDLSNPIAPFTDGVLVVQDVAFHIQVLGSLFVPVVFLVS